MQRGRPRKVVEVLDSEGIGSDGNYEETGRESIDIGREPSSRIGAQDDLQAKLSRLQEENARLLKEMGEAQRDSKEARERYRILEGEMQAGGTKSQALIHAWEKMPHPGVDPDKPRYSISYQSQRQIDGTEKPASGDIETTAVFKTVWVEQNQRYEDVGCPPRKTVFHFEAGRCVTNDRAAARSLVARGQGVTLTEVI